MSNKELIANLRGENLDCNCCAYSRSECSCVTNWPESFCDAAADALEAADKRIVELEAERDEWQRGEGCATKAWGEAERKLAVAREALACIASWARTQYKAQSKGGHATFDMMTLKGQVAAIEEALAQIGGEDGN